MNRDHKSERAKRAEHAQYERDTLKAIEALKPIEQLTSTHLRAMSREGYELSMAHIIAIAKGEIQDAPHSARIRAHESLGKAGVGNYSTIYIENTEMLKTIYFATAKFLGDREKFDQWFAEVQAAIRYPQ